MSRAVKVGLIFDAKLDSESQDDIVVGHPAVAHRPHEAGNGSDHQRNAESRAYSQLRIRSGNKTAPRPSLSSNRQPVLELALHLQELMSTLGLPLALVRSQDDGKSKG